MRLSLSIIAAVLIVAGFVGCSKEEVKPTSGKPGAAEKGKSAKKKAPKLKSPFAIDNLPGDTVVISVNGVGITQQEYQDWLRVKSKFTLLSKKKKQKKFDIGEFTQSVLDCRFRIHGELIRCELVRQYAETNGLMASQESVAKNMASLSNQWKRAITAFPKPSAEESRHDDAVLRKIATMSALDEVCIRNFSTNDLTKVTDEDVKVELQRIEEWNKTADQKNIESVEKAKKARLEILGGALFTEVAKKYAEVAPNEGEEWETFELDEFQADDPMAQWLMTAKQGDISQPIEMEDGYAIVGVRQIIEEKPEDEDEKPSKSYELVRCTFHAYEKIDPPEDLKQFRKDILIERKQSAFQNFGAHLMDTCTIDYPKGTSIFEVTKSKAKRHGNKKKAYREGKERASRVETNTVTAATAGVKGKENEAR